MKISTTTTITLATVLALLLTGQTIASADSLRTVAISGESAPGTGSGVNFSDLSIPSLNDAGQVAFIGRLTGEGVLKGINDQGIWSEGGGSGLALVVRSDAASPDPGGASFVGFHAVVLNDAGQVGFHGEHSESGCSLWSAGGGSGLALLARSGAVAPSTNADPNFSIIGDYDIVFNNSGQTAFFGVLTDPASHSSNSGIWSVRSSTGVVQIARQENAAPATEDGVYFGGFPQLNPAFNDAGQSAFSVRLTGAGVVKGINDSGIWSEGGGNGLALVVRGGDKAPGTNGANFAGAGPPTLNNAGRLAFLGILNGEGVSDMNDQGIWTDSVENGLALVVRKGDVAPGTGGAVFFSPNPTRFPTLSFSGPILNNAGHVTFLGKLSGEGVSDINDQGIWSERGGNGLSLVARTGDEAPDTDGAIFERFLNWTLNDAGQTAFSGSLTGPEVAFRSNDTGIWAEDLSGVLQLIARTGDLLDVDDGPGIDFRTIGSLRFISGTNNSQPSGFNNSGQLAFRASFTDGTSGVFVSNLVAIPEPTTWVLAEFAVLIFFARRR